MSRNLPETLYSIKGANFAAFELPNIKEVRGKEYMYYGDQNLFPQHLIKLYDSSAMHHACVDAIKDGIFGEGIELIGDEYINTKGETVNEVFEKIALDWSLYQGYSINVIWNREGTRIAEIYHLPFANVRSGKMDENDEINEYYYSSDWSYLKKNPAVPYRAFDATDNKGDNASQIYYVYTYTPGNDVYPLPTYVAAINEIELDSRISVFHNANISNGLQPSLFINFRNGIPTEDERNQIYRELENTFASESNAGKFFLGFSRPGEEMQVTPIEAANDDYYITLSTRVSNSILSSHRISSPLLLGVQTGTGFSSNADEIKVAYMHFESTVIEPKRKKVLSSFGYILKLHGLNVSMTVKPKSIIIEDTTVNESEIQAQ